MIHSGPCPALNPATVIGSSSSDDAKIIGITPAVLSLSGRWVLSPPNIFCPTWRFGYCTTMRRWARSTKTIRVITETTMMNSPTMSTADIAPVRPSSRVPARAEGSAATMPEKMISEIPLPTPRAVICSPSHIRKMVPPTSVITVVMRMYKRGLVTATPWAPVMPSSPTAIP